MRPISLTHADGPIARRISYGLSSSEESGFKLVGFPAAEPRSHRPADQAVRKPAMRCPPVSRARLRSDCRGGPE